jgi:hypothetical protein
MIATAREAAKKVQPSALFPRDPVFRLENVKGELRRAHRQAEPDAHQLRQMVGSKAPRPLHRAEL